jgi:hypothetical protein
MIITYRVELLVGGYVTHVESDHFYGSAQGRTRNRSIQSAAVLALENINRMLDSGDVEIDDIFPINFIDMIEIENR